MAPVLPALGLIVSSIQALSSIHAGFNSSVIDKVRTNLVSVASQSWELGVTAEALTELEWPSLSVFNASAFPPPKALDRSNNAADVLKIANDVVFTKSNDSLALIANDGAVGDPASIGVAVLLANWTRTDDSDTVYSTAAGEQLNYLLNYAPRTDTGAISQRADEAQLWADFIYMAPPFIAYFGILEGGDAEAALLQTAYEQISLYRDALRDDDGLWRHIALGSWQDNTHWATGNGWAAAGMLRVLQTLNHSSEASRFTEQSANLTQWIQEIITTAWSFQSENGTLFNVIDDSTSFADSSATALLASVTYRMAVHLNDTSLILYADRALQLVQDSVDEDGWLRNTVDPETFTTRTATNSSSPEGQAFVLLLQSAWRDYAAFISSGASGSASSASNNSSGDDDDANSVLRRCRLVHR